MGRGRHQVGQVARGFFLGLDQHRLVARRVPRRRQNADARHDLHFALHELEQAGRVYGIEIGERVTGLYAFVLQMSELPLLLLDHVAGPCE